MLWTKPDYLVPDVQTLDAAIHRINHNPADSIIDFRNTVKFQGGGVLLPEEGSFLSSLHASNETELFC